MVAYFEDDTDNLKNKENNELEAYNEDKISENYLEV
jgi:hypothetical protein